MAPHLTTKENKNSTQLEDGPQDTGQSENDILRYEYEGLTPELIEVARIELNETDEVKQKSLEKLRKLINEDRKLYTPQSDQFLLEFLRARKFEVKRSLKLLQNHWKFRMDYRHILDTSRTATVKALLMKNFVGFLHHRDRNGCAVFIFKIGQWDPAVDKFELLFQTITAIMVSSVRRPATQVAGYRVILDLRGLSWRQMQMATPTNLSLMIKSTQYQFPARFKGVHIICDSKFASFIWAIAYTFLSKKMIKRVMLGGIETNHLQDFIHPSVLPEEYGGQSTPFDNRDWDQFIEQESAYVLDMLNYGYRD